MSKSRPPCAGLWSTPMVQVNGDVTTCCLDEHLENKVGNLRVQSLQKIWYGATMQRWRRAHVEGRFEDSGPLCTRCNWRSAGAASADEIARWMERFGSTS